jgi:hypothetical protein
MGHPFLQFLSASFKNNVLASVIAGLVAAMGISAQSFAQFILDDPPAWTQNRLLLLVALFITVWILAFTCGRIKRNGGMRSAALAPIAPEYWDHAAFDLTSCFLHDDESPSTSCYQQGGTNYGELTFNTTEIRREWKPKFYLLWIFDPYRQERRRYDLM